MRRRAITQYTGMLAAVAALSATDPARADPPHNPDNAFTDVCKVTGVAVFPDRIHVQCGATGPSVPGGYSPQPTTPTIHYLATESSNPLSDKFVAVATAAWVAGRVVLIRRLSWPDKSPAGCLAGDCRRMLDIAIVPY